MPKPSPPLLFDDLTDDDIDSLIAHPHWEPLGENTDALIAELPLTTERAERTTLLTWIYSQQGVASFEELAAKLTGFPSMPKRKKHLRGSLRALERLRLVSIVTFAEVESDDEGEAAEGIEPKAAGESGSGEGEVGAPDPTGGTDDGAAVGRLSMISLTWTGMVWLRRAWGARERLARHRSIVEVHLSLVEEEDGGKSNDAYWVENLVSTDSVPGAAAKRARRVAEVPAISSIFALAHAAKLDAKASERRQKTNKASAKAANSR